MSAENVAQKRIARTFQNLQLFKFMTVLENVKIGTGTEQRDYSLVDGVYVEDPHTVDTTTLSMAGLKGSNAY